MFFEQLLPIPLLTGSIFFITGLIMYKFPPKTINGLYGYRTFKSMKNQKQWDFAQQYSAILLIKLSLLLLISSFLGLILELNSTIELILSTSLLVGVVIILLLKTEQAISENFT